MTELITAITTGVLAFSATNIDDIVILLLFFSQVNSTFRRWHIVLGQYLGFTALVLASLPGFFGVLILPLNLIGLLGLIPIAIGLSQLLNEQEDSLSEVEAEKNLSEDSPFASFLSSQTYSVVAVTFANGADNVSTYVPLFATSNLIEMAAIIGTFFVLVGIWCYAAYKLTSQPAIADVLSRHANNIVPFVLIALGAFIVLDSGSLNPLKLGASCICLIILLKED